LTGCAGSEVEVCPYEGNIEVDSMVDFGVLEDNVDEDNMVDFVDGKNPEKTKTDKDKNFQDDYHDWLLNNKDSFSSPGKPVIPNTPDNTGNTTNNTGSGLNTPNSNDNGNNNDDVVMPNNPNNPGTGSGSGNTNPGGGNGSGSGNTGGGSGSGGGNSGGGNTPPATPPPATPPPSGPPCVTSGCGKPVGANGRWCDAHVVPAKPSITICLTCGERGINSTTHGQMHIDRGEGFSFTTTCGRSPCGCNSC